MRERPGADPGIEVGGTTHSPPDHREKAVEAASEALDELVIVHRDHSWGEPRPTSSAETALQAADPHLRRAHFEEFREAMLSEKAIEDAITAHVRRSNSSEGPPATLLAIEAALDQAQELLEEKQ